MTYSLTAYGKNRKSTPANLNIGPQRHSTIIIIIIIIIPNGEEYMVSSQLLLGLKCLTTLETQPPSLLDSNPLHWCVQQQGNHTSKLQIRKEKKPTSCSRSDFPHMFTPKKICSPEFCPNIFHLDSGNSQVPSPFPTTCPRLPWTFQWARPWSEEAGSHPK